MKKYLIFAAVATMFAACSQNDDPVLQDKDTPITIASAGVNDLVASRTATPLIEGSLGLYVYGTGLDGKYEATNLQWAYETDKWVNKGTQLVYAGARKQSAYAYYPYDVNAYASGFNIDGTTDLLWWKSSNTLDKDKISINFTHALSLLTINLTNGTDVEETITGVTVGGTRLTATPDFAQNSWSSVTGEVADISATATTTASGMDATYTVLLIPQSTSALKITITAGNRTFVYTLSDEQEFVAGTAYTLNLKIGADKVTPGKISAANWSPITSDNLVTE